MKNRPTKETLIKFARRHELDIDGYYQDEKERDPHKREIDAIVRQLKAVRKQRDELLNDMAEVKRKAKAFDEIAVTVLSEDNDVIKNMNNIVTKIVINNLEDDHEG